MIFVSEVFERLEGFGRNGVTKTQLLRNFGRGREVVLDALAEMIRQGALVVNVGVKGGRLRQWYTVPRTMDTSHFHGYVREGAELGLDVALDGWGRCHDGAFRYETHEGTIEGMGRPLDADFAWCPDWSAAQRLIETSGIDLLTPAAVS
jgi:hypothetical protein